MDITYNELFGIEETAQPAPAAEETAAPAQEAQETAQDTAPAEEAQEGAQEAQEAAKEAKAPQSAEENARQAAGRRIREREAAAEAKGRAAFESEIDEVLRRVGITNTKTGDAVDSWKKLRDYDENLLKARFAGGKATEDDVRRVVREEMAGSSSTASRSPFPKGEGNAAAGTEAAPTEADFAAEIAEIQRMDPSVKDLKSIVESEVGPKFREYVGKGLNFVDAYTLAARSKLAARQAQAAQEAAQVKAAGKDHLSATQSRGGEADIPVPADELEIFRAMMPGTPDAEFRKYYNKNRRK